MSPLNTIFYRSIPTGKDLNGPLLSFIQQPESTITTQTFGSNPTAGIATFIGIATATFPVQDPANPAISQGSMVYQWYEQIFEQTLPDGRTITYFDQPLIVKLSDSSTISGSGTTTLTLSELSSPNDDRRTFYLTADYAAGGTTGNSPNDALESTRAQILVNPTITIDTQPVDSQVTPGGFVDISVRAILSDSDYLPLTYQWFEDGQALNESTTIPGPGSDEFAFTGTKTDTLTVTAGSGVLLPGGGSSQPICVSVIDEVSPQAYVIENSWNSFRNSYPERPFYLLQPSGYTPDRLKIPQSYTNDPLAYAPITVNRDNGQAVAASDWFALMDLSTVNAGTTVSLAVDASGSTTPDQVRASIDLFKQRCAAQGLIVDQVPMETEDIQGSFFTNYENWVVAHKRDLPGGPLTPIIKKYKCVVSNAFASNAPQTSNEVELTIGEPRDILRFEAYNSNAVDRYRSITSIFDPDNGGTTSFTVYDSTFGSGYDIIQFHSPEKDLPIVMRMYGGKGRDLSNRTGGTGGFSEIRFTVKQNTEYTVLGILENSALFLYEKATLVAVTGAGGAAGIMGNGGDGGGVNRDGNPGNQNQLGDVVQGGTVPGLTINGIYGSLYANSGITLQQPDTIAPGRSGGQTITCSKGPYFINQGISPCADIPGGLQMFTHSDGTLMTVGSKLFRGYKAGYNIMETEGAPQPATENYLSGGIGGRGAIGGFGGYSGAGGGGGSGWLNAGIANFMQSSIGGSTYLNGKSAITISLPDSPFDGQPICVSVVDETSLIPNAITLVNSWSSFRGAWPNRPFFILQPSGPGPGALKIPSAYTADPIAFAPIQVNRDENNPHGISDWFELMDLSRAITGTTVHLAIDQSGSMTTETVRASLSTFRVKCQAARLNLEIVEIINPPYPWENWVAPHNVSLPVV